MVGYDCTDGRMQLKGHLNLSYSGWSTATKIKLLARKIIRDRRNTNWQTVLRFKLQRDFMVLAGVGTVNIKTNVIHQVT